MINSRCEQEVQLHTLTKQQSRVVRSRYTASTCRQLKSSSSRNAFINGHLRGRSVGGVFDDVHIRKQTDFAMLPLRVPPNTTKNSYSNLSDRISRSRRGADSQERARYMGGGCGETHPLLLSPVCWPFYSIRVFFLFVFSSVRCLVRPPIRPSPLSFLFCYSGYAVPFRACLCQSFVLASLAPKLVGLASWEVSGAITNRT